MEIEESKKLDNDEKEIAIETILFPQFKEEKEENEEEDPLKIDGSEIAIKTKPARKTGYILRSGYKRIELLTVDPELSFAEFTKRLTNNKEHISIREKCYCDKQNIVLNSKAKNANSPKETKEMIDIRKIPEHAYCKKKKCKETNIPPPEPKRILKSRKTPVRFTSYSMWCEEMRATLFKEQPDLSFGDISSLLGKKWRKLPAVDKYNYRRRAKRMNEKQPPKKEKEDSNLPDYSESKVSPVMKIAEDKKISSKGRMISTPVHLAEFDEVGEKKKLIRKSFKFLNSQKLTSNVKIQGEENL